jgi:hypothetical protein
MLSWKYNEGLLRTYMTEHAEDMGRFWAEVLKETPKFYESFMRGFLEELNKSNKE